MRHYGTLIARYRHARDRVEARWVSDPPTPESAFDRRPTSSNGGGWPTWPPPHLADGVPAWVRRSWRSFNRAATIDKELVQ